MKALQIMGGSKFPKNEDWHLPELANLNRESLIIILNRAAEVGLHSPRTATATTPSIPPCRGILKILFDEYYGEKPSAVSHQQSADEQPPSAISNALSATRAFVEAIGELGNYYLQSIRWWQPRRDRPVPPKNPTYCTPAAWRECMAGGH